MAALVVFVALTQCYRGHRRLEIASYTISFREQSLRCVCRHTSRMAFEDVVVIVYLLMNGIAPSVGQTVPSPVSE